MQGRKIREGAPKVTGGVPTFLLPRAVELTDMDCEIPPTVGRPAGGRQELRKQRYKADLGHLSQRGKFVGWQIAHKRLS